MNKSKVKKFGFLTTFTVLFLLLFSVVAFAASDFNWRKYEGTTIRIILSKSAFTPIALKHIKEFEQLTGIKVIAEHYSSAILRRKLLMELAAKNKDLDMFQGMMKTNYQYNAAGWLEPLDKYIKDSALTSPDYDYEDIYPRVRSIINGKTIGITTSNNPQVLMYRKDLFEKYNVKVPTNWKELEAAAKKLTLDTNGDGKT
ncbi:MAG: extracellular solute-binding protein, partial [Deltaproteobacteria bacterium]|nr:extracellular solute-binding protein [Deltaproteobacteria bacterium]